MIFYTFIAFIVSFLVEIYLINFLSPYNPDNQINLLNAFLFSINTGFLIATIYALLLFFVYWLLKAYDEIIYKSFYRRALLLWILVSTCLFLRLIGSLDLVIVTGLIIVVLCAELIYSKKRN